MKRRVALLAPLALAACLGEKAPEGYAALGERSWVLETIDDTPVAARAEIRFEEDGRVTGNAPCNRFFAEQTAEFPRFELGNIGATRMACADMPAEAEFFAALADMSILNATGDQLILNSDTGRKMVFRAEP